MVDGLLANVGIGIVPLFCLSSLAKGVPVPVACGTDSCLSLCPTVMKFLEQDFGANQTEKMDSGLTPCIKWLSMERELGIIAG